MKRGDLVRPARRSPGSTALGVVMEFDREGVDALVLIDGHCYWVVLKNMEVLNEAG